MAEDPLQAGISAFKSGNKALARQIFSELVRSQPRNEAAWLWLAGCVEAREQKIFCLTKALELNPENQAARKGLEQLITPPPAIPAEQAVPEEPASPIEPAIPTEPEPPAVESPEPLPFAVSEFETLEVEAEPEAEAPAEIFPAPAAEATGWELEEPAREPAEEPAPPAVMPDEEPATLVAEPSRPAAEPSSAPPATPVEPPARARPQPVPPPAKKRRSPLATIFIVLLVVACCAAAVFALYYVWNTFTFSGVIHPMDVAELASLPVIGQPATDKGLALTVTHFFFQKNL